MTRDESIEELGAWLHTAPGRYMLAWEQERLDHAVADAFGFHALQLGLPDSFVEHGDPVRLMALQGLDAHGIQASIRQRFAALLKPLACVA